MKRARLGCQPVFAGSRAGTASTEGALGPTEQPYLTAESNLVIFGDGIEADAVAMTWGQTATVGLAARHLVLVV